MKLTPTAATSTCTSPGPGGDTGTSCTARTEESPARGTRSARAVVVIPVTLGERLLVGDQGLDGGPAGVRLGQLVGADEPDVGHRPGHPLGGAGGAGPVLRVGLPRAAADAGGVGVPAQVRLVERRRGLLLGRE